jgi:imidazolonepropionase-like amidohydrolase
VADLVVLDRDPLADIRNTLSIRQVMIRGRMLSSDSIRARW